MTENKQKTWGKGTLKIFDVELDCYILMDGTPVLSNNKSHLICFSIIPMFFKL
jgi:hypothetical protein